MNIFERASRAKLRFNSAIGDLTTEQLWDLPLVNSRSGGADLDGVARTVSRGLKELGEESFVELKPDPRKALLELMLEIVKHVIASKIADKDAAQKRAENAERRKKLLEILAAKEDEKLSGMTKEEIEAEIAKLSDAA